MSDENNEFTAQVVDAVRGYLRQEFPDRAGDIDGLAPTVSLVEEGFIDSLSFLGLVEFLEKEFEIKVPPDDFVPERFQTMEEMAVYLAAARGR